MKALRWYAPRDIRLEEIPEPSPLPGEVKIQVKWCGICGTDIGAYLFGNVAIPTKKPHPMTGKLAPIILGHEFSGDVTGVGEGVSGIETGARVVVRPTFPCYSCYWCKKGHHIQCSSLATMGLAADGAFAGYVSVRADAVHPMPEGLSYEAASFCEPLAVCIHACNRARLEPGNTVAIVGAGPIGLLMLQTARAVGAGKIFVVEPLDSRRKLAQEMGATETLDPAKINPGKEIARLTDNRRADVVFECAGPAPAMMTAMQVCQRGGKIIAVGVAEKAYEFPFPELWLREQSVTASQGYVDDEFAAALEYLVDGRVKVEPMISAKIGLNDIIEKGFKELTGERRTDYVKILVSPLLQ